MNRKKYIISLSVACLSMAACKKSSFVETNLNPNTLYSVAPADQFQAAASGCQDDFEYYYDVYRAENLWLQYAVNSGGNSSGFMRMTGNFNERYGKIFYGRVGSYLSDIPHLVSTMDASVQGSYKNMVSIASIFKAYYAFYVSDINNYIPYKQAFQARYGGTTTPVYDTQEFLFDSLDTQVKAAVASLESTDASTQMAIGGKDPFFPAAYNGGQPLTNVQEAAAWIKIGNAVRLKMAMRLMKRDPTKLAAVATEVLGDNTNQMSGIADSWVLSAGPAYANSTGNWNPVGFNASQAVINFMNTTGDPRESIFYRPAIKTGTYVGAPASPDDVAGNSALFNNPDTLISQLQHRLFAPNYDEGDGNGAGMGDAFFPLLTYAEYCFIRAELGARSITGDDAATWYKNGVTASIQFYGDRAGKAGVIGYTVPTSGAITAYLGMPGVTYDPTKGVEMIACQAYLDFYRQPSEAWAWWKRTGFPSSTSVLAWDVPKASGTVLIMPRRAGTNVLPTTDANYANQQAAISAMQADPNYGNGPNDAYGRVWWDMP
jgi:hypothetical protein